MVNQSKVSVVKTNCFQYPRTVETFRPGIRYPEYEGELSPVPNPVYDSVRESLRLLGLDQAHDQTPAWNPLGDLIQPGMSVLIKPNLVMDRNHNESGGTDCLYTHPSVVAPVVDYVVKALRGRGKIVVGDAPMQSCDFQRLITQSGYAAMVESYRAQGVEISLVDFRGTIATEKNGINMQEHRPERAGRIIDLGAESAFTGESPETLERLRVTSYDPRLLQSHHQAQRHEYEISNYVLDADVIINMPKPKTHRKAGVTISLKNMIGANVRKEFLPHHTVGALSQGGDEYDQKSRVHALRSRILDRKNICQREQRYFAARWYGCMSSVCSIMLKLKKTPYSEGSWYGNRTINRTIADVNKLVYYAGKDGTLQDKPARKILIVADMIVSGEKEGPVAPSPKEAGIIAAGMDPICFDEAIATLMGMDIQKIPTLQLMRQEEHVHLVSPDVREAVLMSNDPAYHAKTIDSLRREDLLHFSPTEGWAGHIEL